MSRRPRTEEEAPRRLFAWGTRSRGGRKLQREHAGLLAPGRRLHPPSPLSQPVWKQTDIKDSSQPELKAGTRGLRLEHANDEQTESPKQDSSPRVNESRSSQEHAASPRSRRRALSPIQEEEEEEETEKKE
ncbi:uncharacterized protein TrAtP1_010377 [Trichoderma atroviride]|uniref:uncharacterized protein n=1 Tax=Hypocrea atroviridis TaxID=63577 RepID=UPI003323AB70|nr:hypothetical protein TrAtP1_010377 [Trichoderma atroviride]